MKLGSYAYPSGWNHAAFPYKSQSTGKFYAFAGDEAFPYPRDNRPGAPPQRAAGWIHVVEWDEWNEPKEVARYQVPEAGSHNLWVEDDVLYIGYYGGGLRVVDISGELRGDLYRQGREIAFWHPERSEELHSRTPRTFGAPSPTKVNIFLADFTSGLWAVKLVEPKQALHGGAHALSRRPSPSSRTWSFSTRTSWQTPIGSGDIDVLQTIIGGQSFTTRSHRGPSGARIGFKDFINTHNPVWLDAFVAAVDSSLGPRPALAVVSGCADHARGNRELVAIKRQSEAHLDDPSPDALRKEPGRAALEGP